MFLHTQSNVHLSMWPVVIFFCFFCKVSFSPVLPAEIPTSSWTFQARASGDRSNRRFSSDKSASTFFFFFFFFSFFNPLVLPPFKDLLTAVAGCRIESLFSSLSKNIYSDSLCSLSNTFSFSSCMKCGVCGPVDVVLSWSRLRVFFFFQVINVLNVWWEMTFSFVVVVVPRTTIHILIFSWPAICRFFLTLEVAPVRSICGLLPSVWAPFSLYPVFFSIVTDPIRNRIDSIVKFTCSNDFSMECVILFYLFLTSTSKKKEKKMMIPPIKIDPTCVCLVT